MWGVKFDRGKNIIAYFIANISNILLHVNIDIILSVNRLFLALM